MHRTAPTLALGLLLASATALAASTDIYTAPLATTGPIQAKPNILFQLDDSGSMDYEWLPDAIISGSNASYKDPDGSEVQDYKDANLCFSSSSYNTLYYNPATTYAPPIKADGTRFANASYPNAKYDGYSNSGSTTDLTNWYYAVARNSAQAGVCDTNDNHFDKVLFSSLTASQKQNFANWYSYYRKRIYTARAAASFAFDNLDDKYRVGFTTINNRSLSNTNEFLNVNTYDSNQRTSFYSDLFSTQPSGGTPLREALSWAGRYYADKLNNQNYDPMQYSCQKNFTILFTDGYWNGNGGVTLTGGGMGNIDGTGTARPYLDALNKSDTLADTAMYYYNTDLRTQTLNNCTGSVANVSVCSDPQDPAGDMQRMYTHTIGFGLSGTLAYVENYDSPPQGDYLSILQGGRNWPDPIANTTRERLDDLWHAAVNGRGHYYSATNADELSGALSSALTRITAASGSSAAAATSNLEPVAGDNFVYVALYRTQDWYGDLLASTIDLSTGAVALRLNTDGTAQTGTYNWSAKDQLASQTSSTSDSRNIWFFDSARPTNLNSFTSANLSSTQRGYFNNLCGSSLLSQCATLSSSALTSANSSVNAVNYLRGQSSLEGSDTDNTLPFRARAQRLGDIVNSTPVYVKTPPFEYTDNNYASFKSSHSTRAGTVYVGANDGMLHAFNADTGAERWAYVPGAVMPNMYRLLDKTYAENHRFFVDGSPTLADVYIGGNWKTVLVGGLNSGGRGVYALDVTDPSNPRGLWEFTNNNLGLTYGNPIVGKLANGTWVAIVSSGYNNNTGSGDGNGRIWVLNMADGSIIREIRTMNGSLPIGTAVTPSGLGKLNAWIENPVDNTIDAVYGGDLLGNVWRFDINDTIAPSGYEATRLAQLMVGITPQPITTKPELGLVQQGSSDYRVVMVGTGRFLGQSDITDTTQQSVYAFKDNRDATGLGNLRSRTDLIQQTITTTTASDGTPIRNASNNTVDWSSKSGWYINLASSGERVNIDMQLQYDILTFAGNVPGNSDNPCTVGGGFAWLYHVDMGTGSAVSTTGNSQIGERLQTNAMAAGLKVVKLPNGTTKTIVTDTAGGVNAYDNPPPPASAAGAARRTSWRELID